MQKCIPMPNWDDYRVFLAILRHGTLTGAGRDLGLSQPTGGRRLAALEHTLETRLFDRIGRRMLPTPAGHAVAGAKRLPICQLLAGAAGFDVPTHAQPLAHRTAHAGRP